MTRFVVVDRFCLRQFAEDVRGKISFPVLEFENQVNDFISNNGMDKVLVNGYVSYFYTFLFTVGVDMPHSVNMSSWRTFVEHS